MNRINATLQSFSLREKIVILIGFLGYCAIAYRYRSYMGDFGDFVKAGKLIWEDLNPYPQLAYVNSPVSALIAFGLSKALPFLFFPLFWQFLNLAGLAFFFRVFISPDLRRYLPLVMAIFAFLNVTRALFGNGQVTGLVLGLFALGASIAKRNRTVFISMIPIWLALELKPQLAVAFVVTLCFENGIQKARILALTLYVAISHIAIEMFFVQGVNSFWIQKILKYSSASLREGYEISFWKALAIYSGEVGLIRVLSMLSVFATLLAVIIMAYRGHQDRAILIAILLPLQNTYLHLYDLAPLGLLIIFGLVVYRGRVMLAAFCLFVQFFPISNLRQLSTTVIFIICLYVLNRQRIITASFWMTGTFFLGFLWSTFYLSRDLSEELQIINLLVLPVIALLASRRTEFRSLLGSKQSRER